MNSILSRNNVTISGNGTQTMIFAHGFGCNQNTWREVAAGFENEYQIVLFDYVGAGNSDLKAYNSQKYSSLEGYAQDILDICDELQLQDLIIVGHSVSCMIAVIASLKRPELFRKLIFVSPSPYFFSDDDYNGGLDREDIDGVFKMMETNYLGWSSMMAPMIMGNPDRPELGQALTRNFCSTDPKIAREFARVTFYSDNRHYLPLVSVDSLTIQTANDALAPVEIGEYIKKHTPNNSLVNLDVSGHCPHMSAPQETIAAIKAYLSSNSVKNLVHAELC